jgi:hypothetical protein
MRAFNPSIPVVLLLLVSSITHAQAYRCKSPEGDTVYQQTPCSGDLSGDRVKEWAHPRASDVAAAQARLRAEEEERARSEADRGRTFSDAEVSDDLRPSLQQPQNRHANSGPCPAGQVPLNASRSDPTRGWSGPKGYVPLRCGPADASSEPSRVAPSVRVGPGYTEPRRFQDQHGHWYSQPPGSNFATEERTGRQCIVNGAIIVRCN